MDRLFEEKDYILLQLDLKNSLKNYNYVLHCTRTATTAAIDPTDAERILAALAQQNWTLDYILSTHHHADHIGGNLPLKQATGCQIMGHVKDTSRIQGMDIEVHEGDHVKIGALDATVIDVSGHTIGHIAYYFPAIKLLFSGDTVFSMGCGRLFEGDAAMMCESFAKIMALPDDTLICAAHEYSATNATFALQLEPDNHVLQQRATEVERLQAEDIPTVPVMLGLEKDTNPFMRLNNKRIRQYLHMSDADEVAIFAELRERRNQL